MILATPNQLGTTFHTHGVEILLWYLMRPTSLVIPSTLPQCRNFSALPWHRNLLWFLLQPPNSIQPSGLPWCRMFYGTRCSQSARYNPSRLHGVGTHSTLPQCWNCSTLPWHRNLLWFLLQPISSVQPSALPRHRNPFHTSTV